MNLFFSDKPGAHERHLRRKVNNPLFGGELIEQAQVEKARELDQQELDTFMNEFHALAKDASGMDANVDSEVLLALKRRLDQSYECCCGLAGRHDKIKQALKSLIEAIMQSIWHASGNDPQAQSKLEEESRAREYHFELLEHDLIADIMRKNSPIKSDELVPTLLSEPENTASLAAGLLTEDQLLLVCQQGAELLSGVSGEFPKLGHARAVLKLLESNTAK